MGKQLRVGPSVFVFLLVFVSYHDPLFAQGQRAFLASPAEAQAYKGPCWAADLSQDWAWLAPGNTSSGGSFEGPPLKAFTGGGSGKQASQTRCLSINHAPTSGRSANSELVLLLQSVHQEGRSLLWPVWQANRLLHHEPGAGALAHSELGEYRCPLAAGPPTSFSTRRREAASQEDPITQGSSQRQRTWSTWWQGRQGQGWWQVAIPGPAVGVARAASSASSSCPTPSSSSACRFGSGRSCYILRAIAIGGLADLAAFHQGSAAAGSLPSSGRPRAGGNQVAWQSPPPCGLSAGEGEEGACENSVSSPSLPHLLGGVCGQAPVAPEAATGGAVFLQISTSGSPSGSSNWWRQTETSQPSVPRPKVLRSQSAPTRTWMSRRSLPRTTRVTNRECRQAQGPAGRVDGRSHQGEGKGRNGLERGRAAGAHAPPQGPHQGRGQGCGSSPCQGPDLSLQIRPGPNSLGVFTWRHSVICETDFVPPVVAQFLGLQLSLECTLAEHGFRLGSYWRDTRGADGFGAAAKWEPPPSSQLGASAYMDSLSIDEPSGQLVGGFHSAASAPGVAASEDGDLVQSLGQFVHSVSSPLRSCLHRPSAQEAACKVVTKQVSFSSRIDFWFPAVNQVTLPSVPVSSFSEVRHVGLRLPLTAVCATIFSPGLSHCSSRSALSDASPVPSSCLSKGGSCRTLSGSSCGTPPTAALGTHASTGPRPSLSFPCLSRHFGQACPALVYQCPALPCCGSARSQRPMFRLPLGLSTPRCSYFWQESTQAQSTIPTCWCFSICPVSNCGPMPEHWFWCSAFCCLRCCPLRLQPVFLSLRGGFWTQVDAEPTALATQGFRCLCYHAF